MKKLVLIFMKFSKTIKIILTSVIIVVPVFFSALLSNYASELLKVTDDKFKFRISMIVLFIITIIFVILCKIIQDTYESIIETENKKKDVIMYAHSLTTRFTSSYQQKLLKNKNLMDSKVYLANQSLENITELIEALYSLFESKYSESNKIENSIHFEVTFMTKSYIDGFITIPAYANKEKRLPLSMNRRGKQVDIYKNTVTDLVYSEDRPCIHIVENTLNELSYKELYATQKQRIKSSIVIPVLSANSIILGTIVVHCNKEFFFKKIEDRFWNELLEIFSNKIGLEKIKLDIFQETDVAIKLF